MTHATAPNDEAIQGNGAPPDLPDRVRLNTGPVDGKKKTMAKGHHRSAITGRYVKASAAARHPNTTVTESGSGKNKGTGTHNRSAITGRYVKPSTAARHPNNTTTERG